jgi:rhamnosyltransferase
LIQINKADFNHGLTRNFAIDRSVGEFVILLSQDAVPYNEHWMSTLLKTIEEDSGIAGVYCRQIPRSDADILTKRDINRHLTARNKRIVSFIKDNLEYDSLAPREKYIFCNFDNVCSCIRRSVWKRIPFIKTDFAEDIDWSKNVLEAGYKIVFNPETAVIHSHNGSLIYQYRRSYINHKRLYELFRMQPVPTWKEALAYSLCNIIKDSYYIARNEKISKRMLKLFLTLPVSSSAKIFGQYRGAKKAYEDITNHP